MKEPLEEKELGELAARGGMSIKDLLNPGSKGFKDLKLDLDSITDPEAAELINKNPKIMRRPLLTDQDKLVAGFNPEEYRALVGTG